MAQQSPFSDCGEVLLKYILKDLLHEPLFVCRLYFFSQCTFLLYIWQLTNNWLIYPIILHQYIYLYFHCIFQTSHKQSCGHSLICDVNANWEYREDQLHLCVILCHVLLLIFSYGFLLCTHVYISITQLQENYVSKS